MRLAGFKVTVTSQGAASGVAATSEPTARIVDASAHMAFKQPVRFTAHARDKLGELLLVVFHVPTRRGYTRSISALARPRPPTLAAKLLPRFVAHLFTLRFADGDYVLLHDEERIVARRGSWKRSYFLPAVADAVRRGAARDARGSEGCSAQQRRA